MKPLDKLLIHRKGLVFDRIIALYCDNKGRKLFDNITNGNNNISTIRIFLALMVLWSHSFAIYLDDEKNEPLSIVTRKIYNAGNIGVACFLILSGALVLQSWERSKTFIGFVKKRALRIYPAYLVAVFFGAFIVSPIYANVSAFALLQNYFLVWLYKNLMFGNYAPIGAVFNSSPIPIINGSLWSIYYEVICYIFLVLGAILLRKNLVIGAWLLLAILTFAKCFADLTSWNPGFGVIGRLLGWPYLWFSVASWFVTGMLYYKHRNIVPRNPAIAVFIFITLIIITWAPSEYMAAKVLNDIFFIPSIGYILFYICSIESINLERFSRKYDLSYGLYLYGFPIQQIILAEFGHSLPFFIYVILSCVFCTIAAIVSWTLIERRFINLKPQ